MFSDSIVSSLSGASFIRAMFEQGNKLKAQFGAENVYDFSLGNPDPEPSEEILTDMQKFAREKGVHKYMSNAGFDDVRTKVAEYMSSKTGLPFGKEHIVMVTGAAAGLSVTFHSLLNPGEEVIVLAPYFMEYNSYVGNQGCKVVPVKTKPDTFQPDIEAIDKAINAKTKAIIINSPNNPTGAVYPAGVLEEMNNMLEKAEKRVGHPIYVVSDEPYVKILYDNTELPQIQKYFTNCIVVNSFSKSLALPGERIGYIAVSPRLEQNELLIAAMVYSNRTLGFVNAPGLFQKVCAEHLDDSVGLQDYYERRNMLYDILIKAGFSCMKPQGAFYLFPKCPIDDDALFSDLAVKHHIVLVGGKGFGYPGYFRLAYCVSKDSIRNSEKAWKELYEEAVSLKGEVK